MIRKLVNRFKAYRLKRKWRKVKQSIRAVDPIKFPAMYCEFIKAGMSESEMLNRKNSICTSIVDVDEVLNYFRGVYIDITEVTYTNRNHVPGNQIRSRTIRTDAFLYSTTKGKYLSLHEVMVELADYYKSIAEAENDDLHPYNYRVRYHVMPAISHAHEIVSDMLR